MALSQRNEKWTTRSLLKYDICFSFFKRQHYCRLFSRHPPRSSFWWLISFISCILGEKLQPHRRLPFCSSEHHIPTSAQTTHARVLVMLVPRNFHLIKNQRDKRWQTDFQLNTKLSHLSQTLRHSGTSGSPWAVALCCQMRRSRESTDKLWGWM